MKSLIKLIRLALLPVLISYSSSAQVLDCDVIVDASQIQTQDRRVFQDMETAFEEFLNSRDWTSDEFKPEERIKSASER